jgi:hypothetical protein
LIRALLGWCWHIFVGAFFCLGFFSSVAVIGWSYRWIQTLVLRGWWKRSHWRRKGTFEEFCDALGLDAPTTRPRWFLRERIHATLNPPTPEELPPGGLGVLPRVLTVPWYSLWLNLKIGAQGLFCTYLLSGWGCLLMWGGWEFAWTLSFYQGYGQARLGLGISLLGVGLFIVSMLYVPMAQLHQAATGDFRAFFDVSFVWRLIRARPTAYVFLAGTIVLFSLGLEALKLAPANFEDAWSELSDQEFRTRLYEYRGSCSYALFLSLLIVRLVGAATYRSAVLHVVRRGWVALEDLHPTLAFWLDRLQLDLTPGVQTGGLKAILRRGCGRIYRLGLYGALSLIWLGFVADVYFVQFQNYHPVAGFLNRVLVHFPCFGFLPNYSL